MINKPAVIQFDTQAGAWTDGKNYVKGSIIRRYAVEKLGRKGSTRGRLSRAEISAYFLDTYGVSADVSWFGVSDFRRMYGRLVRYLNPNKYI